MRLVQPSADLEKADDAELMKRVQAEDRAAYEVLFHRYYPRVYSFVYRRLRDRTLAEEAVMDVFFEVWRGATSFRAASRPSTWIFGIAHFKALEAHRRRSQGKRAAVVPIQQESLQRAPEPGNAEDRLEARDEIRLLERFVQSLNDNQREAVELVWFEGLSLEEAANRLGVSVDTVKTRVWRARQRARSVMRSAGSAPPPGGTT